MSMIIKLERHTGLAETTLNGIVNTIATYEIVDNILSIRTEAHDTIHITQEIGRKLVDIISKELL